MAQVICVFGGAQMLASKQKRGQFVQYQFRDKRASGLIKLIGPEIICVCVCA